MTTAIPFTSNEMTTGDRSVGNNHDSQHTPLLFLLRY